MDINARVFAAFQAENKEQLQALREIVARGTAADSGALNEALRLAHTMKAGGRVCGLGGVQEMAHRMETLFARLRDEHRPLDAATGAAILGTLEVIEDALASAASGTQLPDPAEALQRLDGVLQAEVAKAPSKPMRASTRQRVLAAFQAEQPEHVAGLRALLSKAAQENGGLKEAELDELLRFAHTLKGGARISGLAPIETLSHEAESVFARVKSGTLQFTPAVLDVLTLVLDSIDDWMSALGGEELPPEPAKVLEALAQLLQPGPLPGPAPTPVQEAGPRAAAAQPPSGPRYETVRLSAEHLDRLLRSSSELVMESQRQDQVSRGLLGLSHSIEEIDREWEAVREVSAAHLHRLGATPEFSRTLHYLEFIERQSRVLAKQIREVRALQQRSSRSLQVLGRELQEDVRKARMIPAESVFGSFRKMVRDLARDEGKRVEFRAEGMEVQADRLVLQALKDPVMHMLRNSVSHGLEAPTEREAAHKTAAGTISLELKVNGNELTVLIDDDGRGLDWSRVKEVAVRKGLLSHADAELRSGEELSRLIFHPGFSTARAITDLSGRGMGLSVVYEAVSRLQGKVRVVPSPWPGTCTQITVPLSISTQRLLLVSSQGQTFALPSTGIQRLIRLALSKIQTVEGKPIIVWEEQPVPLVSLGQLLGIGGGADFTVDRELLSLVILKSGERRLAVAVDDFLAERDGLIKNLDAALADIPILAGGILLEDGTVALVLNAGELIETFRPVYAPPTARIVEAKAAQKVPTVLVVDDSFTARTLEKSILEVHGYNVVVAMDGLEGLSKLRSEEIDLVISDVQMPRMDGLSMLQEMKEDERFARLPVILVTSMDRTEDQERGLALGADAYLVKQRFDHQTLLETIRQLL